MIFLPFLIEKHKKKSKIKFELSIKWSIYIFLWWYTVTGVTEVSSFINSFINSLSHPFLQIMLSIRPGCWGWTGVTYVTQEVCICYFERTFTPNHVSRDTCHMSRATCHMYIYFFVVVGASQYRGCYQWGQPRLVFSIITNKTRSEILHKVHSCLLVLLITWTLEVIAFQGFRAYQKRVWNKWKHFSGEVSFDLNFQTAGLPPWVALADLKKTIFCELWNLGNTDLAEKARKLRQIWN